MTMAAPVEELWSRAQIHIAAKQAREARAALEALLVADPAHVLAQLALCDLAWREGRVREATQCALDAAASAPPYPETICDVVAKLLQVGEAAAARELLQHAALTRGDSDLLLLRLADDWHRLGEEERALDALNRAKELGFDGGQVRFHRGQQLLHMGREQEAEPDLELGLLLTPNHGRAALALAHLRKQTRERNHLNRLVGGLKKVAQGSRDYAALEFALYKELEDVERYDDAWPALLRGNAAMAARKRHDVSRQRQHMEQSLACYTQEFLRPADELHAGPQPIFIIGLPRCGASVLERMLGKHSRVHAIGEPGEFARQVHWTADHPTTQDEVFLSRLADLDHAEVARRYLAQMQWRAHAVPLFTDWQPNHWMIAGLIGAAFPRAPILHVTRDAMDVCFSQFRAFFGDAHAWSYDLAATAANHHDYRKLMAHWHALMPGRILDVPFAGLIGNPEATLRNVLAFCNLQWEPACGDAALDAERKPFGAWQPYAAPLAGMRQALGT